MLGPQPGWYAVSVNHLYGYGYADVPDLEWPDSGFRYFRRFTPVAKAGYSIYIFHLTPEETDNVRKQMGLPQLPRL
jgi:hypothetical protein